MYAQDSILCQFGPRNLSSVQQLISQPILIHFWWELYHTLTKQPYKYTTVFVDQCSRLSYIYLQQMITSNEMVQAKITFERYSEERGVHIWHYHADNGRFANKGFIDNCQLNNQCSTYCGVNVHFQNGIAEKKYGTCKKQQELPCSSPFINGHAC